ncbi:amino acid adenylation domain-containing protein [Legionella quateirensis]|uniref:Peptide synthetase, non-ribosomal n=1 Tax=Legionella quateirensis TaxID=45072 RepID=A0A378KRG9_9GAMM|nr:amino acid adenylation domain-containing protein [Legionella quateirensis]KTD53030.1 peptide synthetase, non-ribosomal [Legionella quateirensis]STY17175.1 peptide synthetase, non-ribosomal [Legionella quateirensis]
MPYHFIQYFNNAVKHYADKPALYFDKEIYSYEIINRLSNKIAYLISQFDLPKETIIPLMLERTPHIIIAMIGILKSGCAFLPISPSSPCSRIEYILEETKAKLLFCDKHNSSMVPDGIHQIQPDTIYALDEKDFSINYEDRDLAYVMYTSGSTGTPKGVLIEHQSMMNLFSSLIETLNLSSNDLFLALTDYTFDISLIELLMPLTLGSSIVLTEHGVVADGKKIKRYLRDFDISLMQATPLTWEILLKNGWKNNGLMRVLVGGEQFKTNLALKLQYEKGNVWNVYGPTETSMWSMMYHLEYPILTESVPLGEPVANTYLKLINDDNSSKAELYIGGRGVARGYLNAEVLSKTKFILDEKENIRYYATGDLVVHTDNNMLCYVGRKDNQLKFGGIRIEAGEIEVTIEQEVFVKKAVVKIHEHNDYYKTLAAYIEIDEALLFSHGMHIISEDSSDYMGKIYDEAYIHAKEFESKTINTCGWQNSFTGTIFQSEELSESYNTIRQYIQKANLDQVLEVGCGTGFLLLDYLPKAQHVTLVEISQKAIDYVQSIIPTVHLHKITFKLESIVNIHEVNQYSCIVVNSVIQYLPSIKSLLDTLKQLVKATQSGGTILIGDVRSLELLDFYLAIKHARHHPEDTEICPSNLFYKSRDSEIVLSPLFFYALKQQFKRISWVDINVKHGHYLNELNYFRYDVVIHIDKEVTQVDCQVMTFNELQNETVLEKLINQNAKPIKIHNIPYDYFSSLCDKLSIKNYYLDSLLKLTTSTLEEKKRKNALQLIHGQFDNFESFIQYQPNAPQSHLQMLLVPILESQVLIRPFEKEKFDTFHAYGREPFSPWLQKFCFDHIKMNVKKHIMSWVNPSIYIWVEQWPQTINGKLDRKKLLLPSTYHPEQENGSILSQLKHIWFNITGDIALVEEEFWTHGVSSLSMYYFLATINETFHLNLTYHQFHQYNTMEKVAVHIEHLLKTSLENETGQEQLE